MAAFGLPPVAHEDDAARSVQAALEIQAKLQRLGLRLALGLATGRAFCGSVGSGQRREYTMIGGVVNLPGPLPGASFADPRPDAPITLTYREFADGLDRLQAVGFPMEQSRQEAWRHFRGWRVNYEAAAYLLADQLGAVPAPWSGERPSLRLRADQMLPVRPRHRSPDDPEGRTPPAPTAGGVAVARPRQSLPPLAASG